MLFYETMQHHLSNNVEPTMAHIFISFHLHFHSKPSKNPTFSKSSFLLFFTYSNFFHLFILFPYSKEFPCLALFIHFTGIIALFICSPEVLGFQIPASILGFGFFTFNDTEGFAETFHITFYRLKNNLKLI